MTSLLEPDLCTRLALVLLHFVWQGVAIAVLAGLVVLALRRRSAGARYGVWLGALLLMAACPTVTFFFVQAPPSSAALALEAVGVALPAASVARPPGWDRGEPNGPGRSAGRSRRIHGGLDRSASTTLGPRGAGGAIRHALTHVPPTGGAAPCDLFASPARARDIPAAILPAIRPGDRGGLSGGGTDDPGEVAAGPLWWADDCSAVPSPWRIRTCSRP